MPRQKNPRRQVLEALKPIQDKLTAMRHWWTCTSTKYEMVRDSDGTAVLATLRPRLFAEYPENDSFAWNVLYNEMGTVIAEATALRELARQKYQEIQANEWEARQAAKVNAA